MRILITGPMGYVGPIVTRHLRAAFSRRRTDRLRQRILRPQSDRRGAAARDAAGPRCILAISATFRRNCSTASMPSFISRPSPTTRWARNSRRSPKRSTKRPASRWRRWREQRGVGTFRLCVELQHLRRRRRRPQARERCAQSADRLCALQGRDGKRAAREQCRTR